MSSGKMATDEKEIGDCDGHSQAWRDTHLGLAARLLVMLAVEWLWQPARTHVCMLD